MSKRITCIALFDEESLEKLYNSIKLVNNNFCKVPFREINRKQLDTLPYHFTFTVWDENEANKAIDIFDKIQFNAINLKIKGVNIKESFNNSWNLYFEVEKNQSLYDLQKKIYNLAQNEKYNPDYFIPHITFLKEAMYIYM